MKSNKRILALALALVVALTTMPSAVLAMPTGSTHSLTTTFSTNNSYAGNMFDVSVMSLFPVEIDGFDIHLDREGSNAAVSVYIRNGSYVGADTSSAGWSLAGTQTVTSAGAGSPTSLNIGDIVLHPGQRYGFYITVTDYATSGVSICYSNGDNTYSDGNLTITAGLGKAEPAFIGNSISQRTWNGTIYYHIAHAITASAGSGGIVSPQGTAYVASGSSFTYAITPNSGYHIASVLVDGVEQGPIDSYTFTNVQAPHTIAAGFAADAPTPTPTPTPTVQDDDSGPTYIRRTLTSSSGTTLSGTDIHRSAGLTVRNLDENVLPSALREAASGGRMILGYDVSLSRGFRGSIDLSFPVGSAYEGQLVTILHYVNGKVETYTAVVTSGMATVTVNSLSPFVVLATGVTTPDAVVADPPKTGGAGSAQGLVMVLVALGGIAMLKRRKAN